MGVEVRVDNSRKIKVGSFVLGAVVLFGFGIIKLGDVSFRRTYKIYVYFDDVSGMAAKSPVKLAGVEIGKIRKITLEGGKARAELHINRGVVIYKDAMARVASTGIIGTKYLDISSGNPSAGRLENGDALSGLSSFGLEESMGRAMESIEGLTKSVRGRNDELGKNLNSMVANLNASTLSIREILDDRKHDISAALLSLRRITASMSEILDKTDRILAKVEQGEGGVGALLVDKKVGEDVKASVAHVKEASAGAAEVFGRFTRVRAFWDYRYRYDDPAEQGRSDFSLKLSPRPGKYYFMGASNVGDKNAPLKVKDFEKKNTLNIGLGHEFFPWLDLYAGVIRSEGGLGARVKPFYAFPLGDRLTVEAEAYGLGRDTTFNNRRLEGAVYNVGLAAQIFPWLRIVGRQEDMGDSDHFHGGFNVVLEDKDLAYILGLVSVTR
ncbi:MAG: MCE family protein [Elusimicrobia bacterium]|nr:MCE family protein [Elusimicrobiota bacterium]